MFQTDCCSWWRKKKKKPQSCQRGRNVSTFCGRKMSPDLTEEKNVSVLCPCSTYLNSPFPKKSSGSQWLPLNLISSHFNFFFASTQICISFHCFAVDSASLWCLCEPLRNRGAPKFRISGDLQILTHVFAAVIWYILKYCNLPVTFWMEDLWAGGYSSSSVFVCCRTAQSGPMGQKRFNLAPPHVSSKHYYYNYNIIIMFLLFYDRYVGSINYLS